MNVRDMMRNSPGWVIAICLTIVFVTITTAFVFLAVTNADSTQFQQFLQTAMNFSTMILAGTGVAVAGAAAKSAHNADKQTNGVLEPRIKNAVHEVLNEREEGAEDGRPSV